MKKILLELKSHHFILAAILFLTFFLRFPSLFEPFWYGDEGIFAAVARNLNQGGVLYQTAWDNKPPMIYLTYQAIFKLFGVSMFWLHLAAAVAVLATAAIVYEIAQEVMGEKRALVATLVFGVLTSLRLIEGDLALTEIFMILPISLAMLIAVKRKFDYKSLFVAGVLFAIASLYKQVGALEAAALGLFLFFESRNFVEFVKKGVALSLGFLIPYLATVAYFYPKHLVGDYIFAAYTYYRIYLNESPRYAIFINIAKYLPVLAAFSYGLYKKIRFKKVELWHLFLLWMAFSFLGSYFSGRTYGHYLVQATPATALLAASISFSKVKINKAKIIFALSFFLPLLFLTRLIFSDFITGGPINQMRYWNNFISYAAGRESVGSYNDYFDRNVNTIMALSDFLSAKKAYGKSVYIWGDMSWLYAIANAHNPARYVTSFHVFGVPNGKEEVATALNNNPPLYIIKPQSSIGYFEGLEKLISNEYTFVAKINGAEIYARESGK
jgi:4-amino-4-deoxy-L-arabinose transferase-like glycosyltransferase